MNRFNDFYRTPLMEGEVPRSVYLGADGQFHEEEPVPYEPPEDVETDTYIVMGNKAEYYDHVTVCKACLTRFIAFDTNYDNLVRAYCPGCGKKLLKG